jgi:3-hydroxyisobutyrate dehydrogenase-like beta-hydroxyacid dehydrogenase
MTMAKKAARKPAKKAIRNVGMIGLGKMGLPMTRHLLTKGFAVSAYDINPWAVKAAVDLGAKAAPTPGAVASASDMVIIVVGFEDEVDTVLGGKDGILAKAKPGTIVAVASTVSPTYMRELGSRKDAKRVVFVDAPLCRGEPAAEKGNLLVMGGGEKKAFEACRPAFASFADAIHHLGGLGAGQVGKMINNQLLWACVSINYEGLKLATALGVEEETMRQALLLSSGNNWALETWLQPRPMPWAEKDMTLVLAEADAARVALPLSGAVKEVSKGIKIEKGLPMPTAKK